MPDVTTSFALSLDTLMSLFFFFVLGSYAIFTAILYYHWQTYATDDKVSAMTLGLYFVTTIPLLMVMGLMLVIM